MVNHTRTTICTKSHDAKALAMHSICHLRPSLTHVSRARGSTHRSGRQWSFASGAKDQVFGVLAYGVTGGS